MSERIFWDTWAFIALTDSNSHYHETAKAIQARLKRQQAILITSEAVLTELGNAFSKQHLRPFAQQHLHSIEQLVAQQSALIINIDKELWQTAWELYIDRPDKDWGHTDCISFVVMQRLGITQAFTGDRHFEQAGFIRLVQI